MRKPQYIVDAKGNKVGVLLSVEDYTDLIKLETASFLNEPDGAYLKDFRNDSYEGHSLSKALYEIYMNLPEQIKAELYELIAKNMSDQSLDEFLALTEDSFAEIWNTSENEHWDQFIKDRLNV